MTEMSMGRRKRLLEEMHDMGDSRAVTDDPNRHESFTSPLTYGELRALLSDSAWRERVERQVVEVCENDLVHAWELTSRDIGMIRDKLRAIVDTESDK